jgi:biotin operon repressor
MTRVCEELGLFDTCTRLAHELDSRRNKDNSRVVSVTEEELAACIGTTPSGVNRGIRHLREEGLIVREVAHKAIRVIEPDRLATYGEDRR